jgi:RNA polymerase sigma-70 factor (ECF subfamily)
VLARRAALGDRMAFAVLFRRHSGPMFRYAMHMLNGDVQDAEDAVQNAWTQAWQHLGDFRGEAELRTWLFRITANQVLNARRRRRPIAVDDALLTPIPARAEHEPERQTTHEELRQALSLALYELPWRQRASWLLREMEGLSYEEIADILGTTPTIVRGQLHRARRTLAVRMAQWR